MESPNRPPHSLRTSSPIGSERTRTLIVNRDENSSFGLTLSGDRPVSVQTVRPGGSADRAGIREKDVIVKVNGKHVTQSTHSEVVELIAGGARVALTVIQAPSSSTGTTAESESVSPSSTILRAKAPSPSPSSRGGLRATSACVTAPQPPNTEAIRALSGEKMHTMQLMVEQERRYVDQLRQDFACSNSPKIQQELDLAIKRLGKVETQLEDFKKGKASGRPQSAILTSTTSVAAPAIPPRPESSTSLSSVLQQQPQSPPQLPSGGVPPPLPARNRSSTSSLGTSIEGPVVPPPVPPPRRGLSTASNVPPPPNIPLPEIPASGKALKAHQRRSERDEIKFVSWKTR